MRYAKIRRCHHHTVVHRQRNAERRFLSGRPGGCQEIFCLPFGRYYATPDRDCRRWDGGGIDDCGVSMLETRFSSHMTRIQ